MFLTLLFIEFIILNVINFEIIPDLVSIILIFINSILFFIQLNRKFRKYLIPVYFGYILRVLFMFWDIYMSKVFLLPNSGKDSEMFYLMSVNFKNTGYSGLGQSFSEAIGYFYRIVGSSKIFGQYFILLLSIFAIAYFIKTLEFFELTDKSKIFTIYIISLLPNFAILSSIFLRESIVVFFVSISFYNFAKWWKKNKKISLLLSYIYILIGAIFHSGIISILISYIVIMMIFDNKLNKFKLSKSNIIMSVIFVFILAIVYLNYSEIFFRKMLKVDSLEEIGSTWDEGGASYAKYVGDTSSILNLMIYSIPRFLYFNFSPFPWQWRNIFDIIAFIYSSLFYIYIFMQGIKIKKYRKNRNDVIIIFLIWSLSSWMMSWGVTNFGAAIRHRDKLITIAAMLLPFIKENKKEKKNVSKNIKYNSSGL